MRHAFNLWACLLLCCGTQIRSQTNDNSARPSEAGQKRTLYVLSPDTMSAAEQMLAISIQGLANRSEARAWLRTPGMSAHILTELQAEGWQIRDLPSVWDGLRQFKTQIRGLIVCKLGTESVNTATSLCGLLNGVLIDESLLDQAKGAGLKVLADARSLDARQVFSQFRSQFGRGVAVEQSIEKTAHLRDYAIAHHAFTYSTTDSAFRSEVARTFGPDALVWGWGDDEFRFVRDVSKSSGTTVPADWGRNFSAIEHLPVGKLTLPRHAPPWTEDGFRYVAFVMSDGDNVQWLGGGFADDPKYWASSLRGTFPMTWEASCLMGVAMPRALRYLYATAKPNDGFVAGSGAPGYTYPYFQTNRKAIADQAGGYLRASDLSVVSVLNANEGSLSDTFPLLDRPEVAGILYKDYAPYNRRKGEIAWHSGKPCLSYKFLLWEGVQSVEETAQGIAQMPADPRHDQGSYALVQVHAWSYQKTGGPLEAVRRTLALLPPNVRVVTAPDLIALLRANFGNQQAK